MANIYDMVDEWDDGATTFTGIGLNVTDTASGASSLLLDLQVGGSSKFKVNKGGDVIFGNASGTQTYMSVFGGNIRYRVISAGFVIEHYASSFSFSNVGIRHSGLANNTYPFFESTTAGSRVAFHSDGDNIFALRRTTNAQTFNLYNTYTDASNYERGFMQWSSNELNIGTEATGTGTGRSLRITSATGQIGIYNGASRYWLFQLGTSARSFTPSVDIVGDIGAASLRIRDFYVGRNVFLSGLPTTDPVSAGQLWNDAGTLKVSAG